MIPAFANPLLLWGVAAAAVPILIHLLNRRRFRIQRWAAMEWLLAAAKQNQKRLRMENLLLLLLRTCAVLFLALAIARPMLSDTRLTLDKQASHLFVLLDNSASTGAKTGTGTIFESAANSVSSLLSEIGSEDPVTLVLTNDDTGESAASRSGRPRVVLPATHDHQKVRQFVSDLKPAPARADLVEALKVIEDAVSARGTVVPKVAILTDLQRASFEEGDARGSVAPDAAIRATLERLRDKGAEVVLMPFGRSISNVAVTSLTAQGDRDIVQGETVVFEAEVRNFGDHAVSAEVRFLVDGKERGEVSQPVPLGPRPAGNEAPPAGSAQYTTTFREDEVGIHVIEARITADALPVDDVRTFAFEVRKPIRVLAVDGDPSPSQAGASPETFWLKPALAIKPDGPITVQTVTDGDFEAERDLSAWDLVILANVEHPARTEELAKRLAAYVAKGGSLLLTVGDRVVPDVWNRELHREGAPLLPALLDGPRVDKSVELRFDLSENRHPILVDITNPANAVFFRSPLIWGRMALRDPAGEKGSRVVLTYSDLAKSPALIERPYGRGRVLLYTSTVDDAWGKLPGNYLNPVLLYETVCYLTAHGNNDRNLLAYQTYTRAMPDNYAGFEVTYPDGTSVTEVKPPDETTPYATVAGTNRLGAYRAVLSLKSADILAPAPPPIRDAFAVNLTPLESDLAQLRPEDVEARWPGLLRVATTFGTAADAVRPKGGELHGPLLVAALLCLLGEVLLVRRIATSRTAAA